MRRPLIAVTTAAALLAVPAAADAAPGIKMRKGYVTFKGSQDTRWNQPEISRKRNCYETAFHFARGSEKWSISTRKPVKALFVNAGGTPILHLGSHDIEEPSESAIEVASIRTRQRTERGWVRGGDCGGGYQEHQFPPTDCGTRLPTHELTPLFTGNDSFKFTLGTLSNDPNLDFDNCGVIYPQGISERFLAEEVAAHSRSFLRAKKATQVTYKKRFKYKLPPGGRPTTSTTTVQWKFTFRPVK